MSMSMSFNTSPLAESYENDSCLNCTAPCTRSGVRAPRSISDGVSSSANRLSAATIPRCTIGITVVRRLIDGNSSIIATMNDMNLPMVQRGIAAAERPFALLDTPSEIDRGARTPERVQGAVQFKQLSFSYDSAKGDVLKDIDIAIAPGQCVAFVGRSGSGKTTLVSLLPRLYDVERGAILLDGTDIREFTLSALRDHIAWVGQDVVLFNDTIARNIAYGARGNVS